jgi:anaerobic carbon-monoxide dehydrogenase iron sulfur subunit
VACPPGALTEDLATGLVNLNDELCNGCGECVTACPFDAIWMDEHRGVAIKCDLCGGEPVCVRYCAPGALMFKGVKTELQKDE